MSETHSLGLIITNVVLTSIILDLFKVSELIILLLIEFLHLLLVFRGPHSISVSVGLIHYVHLGLKLEVKFLN